MSVFGKLQENRKKVFQGAMLLLLLILQLTVLLYYADRKAGFHEDEFYSYYSTNKTAGLFVEDRTWQERDNFRNDFVVLENERFRYNIVKQMQSWDVHPPFYYYLLHTVCSLFPGIFSKWLGIAVNIAAFIPCFFLLFSIVRNVMEDKDDTEGKRATGFAFMICLFWGFSGAVISGAMFIRMYQWLTLFILLLTWLHVKAWKKEKFGIRFYFPLAATVFLGFMTQYYYIIFHVFLGAGLCLLLLKGKRIKELFLYGFSCGVGLLAAILYYPASFSHIFRGYRGTEAVSEFSNADNTLGRLNFFVGLFDDYVVNGTLAIFLLLICLGWLTVAFLRKNGTLKKEEEKSKRIQMIGLLLFACVGYFFTISKTALLLGETSNRYQLPIYGIVLFLLLYFTLEPVRILIQKAGGKKQAFGLLGFMTVAAIAGILITSHFERKVFFLYEEEAEIMEYVEANKDVPVVVYYREDSAANVWRLSDELMVYPRIYLANQNNKELITDTVLTGSDRLLVYVADKDDKEACLENLLQSNENLSSYSVVAEKNLWTLYEMN